MELLRMLRSAGPPLAIVLFILFAGIIFAVSKMATAFQSKPASPAYQNSPATAFVRPTQDTIIDVNMLASPRLPDEAYLALTKASGEIANQVATRKLNRSKLERLGLDGVPLREALSGLRATYSFAGQREGRRSGPIVLSAIVPDPEQLSASLGTRVTYGSGVEGPTVPVDIRLSYVQDRDRWLLAGLETRISGG